MQNQPEVSHVSIKPTPGLFTEFSARQSLDRYVTGQWVRFHDGQPQKIGGYVSAAIAPVMDAGGTTWGIIGVPRASHIWDDLNGQEWISVATGAKLYLISLGQLYDITPIRRQVALTNAFATNNTSNVVTVTDPFHNANNGDYVNFSGATAFNGVTLNGQYVVANATTNTYQVTAHQTATGTGSGGGTASAIYDINAGVDYPGFYYGWGSGAWGQGTWGTPRTASTMVQPIRLWALSNWGQGLMASIRNGSVFYWDRATGPQARAVDISLNPLFVTSSGAPVNSWWTLVSPTQQQLVCLGASHDGTNDGLYIAISDIDDFTDFTPQPSNSAYTGRVSSGSRIITGVNTRSGIFLMTDTAAYLLQPNAASVYASEQIGENTTIMSPTAAIDVNGDVFVMGLRKWYHFDGVMRELPSEVWSQVWNNFNYTLPDVVTSWHNDQWSEVWWFYASASATEVDSYVIYNYKDKNWSFGKLQRTTGTVTSEYYGVPMSWDAAQNTWQQEMGYDQVLGGTSTAIPSFVQTYDIQTVQRSPYGAITPGRGLAYNEGAEQIHISAVIPDIISLVGSMYLTIQTKRYPRDAYITRGPYNILPATNLISTRARGKLANFTFGSNALGAFWRIGNFTYLTQDDGER